MKKSHILKTSFLVVFMIVFALLASATAVAQEPDQLLATVTIEADEVVWQPQVASAGFVLTISGPGDFYLQQTYPPSGRITFRISNDTDSALPDGVYHYELLSLPLEKPAASDESERGLVPSAEAAIQSGHFAILDGSFVLQDVITSTDRDPGGFYPQDQLIADDLIVTGSACVGFDCVNGESFGFDTIRLKENNLRIQFVDTSSTGSFPSNDWMLVANDSANGGANYFAIQDVDHARIPFLVEAGAPSYSLYVEDYGRVGLGTSTPVVELHIKDSDTPTVRLEQDSSGGWSPQTWDVAGNESNFFIRDVTNGSKLPFRIRPGAPSNALFVESNGDIGIGTDDPAVSIHIVRTGSDPKLILERMDDHSTRWAFVNVASGLRFAADGIPVSTLDTSGNMTIEGSLTQNSNFYSKENFEPVDPRQVLALLEELSITTWNFKADDPAIRHLGPMAQDFYQAFGFGADEEHIAPLDVGSVALAAIQGLNEMVQEKDTEISALEAQNAELEARLSALEQAIDSRLAPQPWFVTMLPWLLCAVLVVGLGVVMSKRLYAVKE